MSGRPAIAPSFDRQMLVLDPAVHRKIRAHGAAAYPHEGCGLLLGRYENGRNIVTDLRVMENVWPVEAEKPVRFRIDPEAWKQAELEALEQDLDVVGVFHSHPDHPPIASPRDLAWASWPGFSYLITRVEAGVPRQSRSWQLAEDRSRFVEEEIKEKS